MAKNVQSVSFDTLVTRDDLRRGIPLYGATITPIIQSEPGCGKTMLLKDFEQDFGDKYDYVYLDCPVMDVSDLGMRIPVHQTKHLEYYVASILKPESKKPKFILADEFMKSAKMLQVIFTRMFLERCVGDYQLPEGSIVFGTSNNQSDGVGDTMLAHAGNRVMMLKMAKPNATQWNLWATENKISSVIRAWVAMNPRCLASYLDGGQEDNPYIFNPAKLALSFVSPRSLAKADIVVRNSAKAGQMMTKAALAGTLGTAAAESMSAFMSLENEIVLTKDVIKNPMTVRVPEKPAAIFMMMFNALDDLQTQEDLTAFMQFVDRIGSREVEAVFFTLLVQNKRTVRIAKGNTRVTTWAAKNIELF